MREIDARKDPSAYGLILNETEKDIWRYIYYLTINDNLDWDKRVENAMDAARIGKDARKRILYKDELYMSIVTKYFMATNQKLFELWMSLKMMYHGHMRYLRQDSGGDEKIINTQLKIASGALDMVKAISDIESKLFGTEELAEDVSFGSFLTGIAERYASDVDEF